MAFHSKCVMCVLSVDKKRQTNRQKDREADRCGFSNCVLLKIFSVHSNKSSSSQTWDSFRFNCNSYIMTVCLTGSRGWSGRSWHGRTPHWPSNIYDLSPGSLSCSRCGQCDHQNRRPGISHYCWSPDTSLNHYDSNNINRTHTHKVKSHTVTVRMRSSPVTH